MDERKLAAEEAAARDYGASSSSDAEQQQENCNPPAHLETIALLSSLSQNPSNVGLIYQVARAGLESLNDQLVAQVAQCEELEEERAANQFVDANGYDGGRYSNELQNLRTKIEHQTSELEKYRRDRLDLGTRYLAMKKELERRKRLELADSGENDSSGSTSELQHMRMRLEDQAAQLERYHGMDQKLKAERRHRLELSVKYMDLKNELEMQDKEIARDKEALGLQDKELGVARNRLETQSIELRNERHAHRDLQIKYKQQAAELQKAQAQVGPNRCTEERMDLHDKELSKARSQLEKELVELRNERQAHHELHVKYEQQAAELQEAKAQIDKLDRPWDDYENIKAELMHRNMELRDVKTKQKTLQSDVDAARAAIVELSSQLEGQLDELEELRAANTAYEERFAELEQESSLVEQQGSEMAHLKSLLEEKEAQLEQQRRECERIEERHRLELEDEKQSNLDVVNKLATLKGELATIQARMDSQTVELQRAIAERDVLRINSENERNEKMARLKEQYASATTSTTSQNGRRTEIRRQVGRRARRVANEDDLRAMRPLDCIDSSLAHC